MNVASVDPVQPLRRVDLGPVVVGVEAVAQQPPARVEDEDLEQRLAEPERGRPVRLGERPDQQVHVVDVVAALARRCRRGRAAPPPRSGSSIRSSKDAHRLEPDLAAQLVERGHAALPVAVQVDRPEVHHADARHRHVLHRRRVVVVDQGAGQLLAERPGQGLDAVLADQPVRPGVPGPGQRHVGGGRPVQVDEVDDVGEQRVQPVDGGELLAQPVLRERALRVADDPAELAAGDRDVLQHVLVLAAEGVGDQAVPVAHHPVVERVVRQDGRGPLDGVDLGHHRGVDQPGRLEQRLVVPGRVALRQQVADRVVLAREEGVQQRRARPTSCARSR